MPARTANAEWRGSLARGKGTMRMKNAGWEGPYSAPSRFEEGEGASPEELIAAAHAGCFSMAFADDLTQAGFEPEHVATRARVHLDRKGGVWTIHRVHLETEAAAPGLEEARLQEIAQVSKDNCPVSRALAEAEITVEARLAMATARG